MEPTLDNWTTIFLLIAAQGFLLFLLLLLHKNRQLLKNKILAGIILSFSLMLLYYVAFWSNFLPKLPYSIHILGELIYAIAPMTYLYVLLINNKKLSKAKWIHLSPFFVVTGLFITLNYRFGGVLQNLYLLLYTYLIWNSISKKSSTYSWSKQVASAFSMLTLGFTLYYILVWNRWLTPEYDYWISASMSFFIYFIGYKAILNPKIMSEEKPTIKYEKSLVSKSAASSIASKIISHIETEKIYKRGEYKLSNLSDELSIPSHTISQVLNLKLNQSFNELINSYRIKEAKKLLQEQENASIISIAYSVGFNNKVSFNNSFKKHTGYTPSEFRNRVEKKVHVSLN